MPTLTQLAEEALANARLLDAYTTSKGLPPCSLENDTLTFANLPPELKAARSALADGAKTMRLAALGPVNSIMEVLYSVSYIPPPCH
jgi:hypothetical protein